MEEIVLNGITYVRKDEVMQHAPASDLEGMPYCMVRTRSAGVFAGYVADQDGTVYTLLNARRIWFWAGAASLSQLATEGTSKPEECKFPCEVDSVTLTEVIEVIPMTAKAKQSIAGVPVWQE